MKKALLLFVTLLLCLDFNVHASGRNFLSETPTDADTNLQTEQITEQKTDDQLDADSDTYANSESNTVSDAYSDKDSDIKSHAESKVTDNTEGMDSSSAVYTYSDSVIADTKQTDSAKDSNITDYLKGYDFNDINQVLDTKVKEGINFEDIVKSALSGKLSECFDMIIKLIQDTLLSELANQKELLIQLLIITIIAAVFSNFAGVFEKQQITDISFYVVYLLLFTILIESFYIVTNLAADTLDALIEFMRALVPSYFLSVAIAGGTTSSVIFYQFTLGLILGVEWGLKNVMIPLINIYVVFALLDNLSKEEILSHIVALIKMAIEWIIKTMLAVVLGFNVIQSLIAPVIDTFKTSIISKTASILPGIGNAADAVTEMVIGSAVIIKNGIGVAALFIIVLLAIVPIIKLAIFAVLYKALAAIIQPISDKRIVGCISMVGDGGRLILKATLTAMLLFLLTIAIVTASTNRGF